MTPAFFEARDSFRAWRGKHQATKSAPLAGFDKTGTKRPSVTRRESADEAVCCGWTDGRRRYRE